MTDHPSNPPSQGPGCPMCHGSRTRQTLSLGIGDVSRTVECEVCIYADSALAAQEARHKAEMERVERERDGALLRVENALEMADVERDQYLEAESKLRQATEALRWMLMSADANWEMEPAGGHDWPQACAVARVVLAAIRSGPARDEKLEQACANAGMAVRTPRLCSLCGEEDAQWQLCSFDHRTSIHWIGKKCASRLWTPASGPAQQAAKEFPADDHCASTNVDVPGAGDGTTVRSKSQPGPVAHLRIRCGGHGDPPEQETPKPEPHTHSEPKVYCRHGTRGCVVVGPHESYCNQVAPPAHGGGD